MEKTAQIALSGRSDFAVTIFPKKLSKGRCSESNKIGLYEIVSRSFDPYGGFGLGLGLGLPFPGWRTQRL